MKLFNATTGMLVWNANGNEVDVIEWPDRMGRSNPYMYSTLACWDYVHEMDFEQRKCQILAEAMTLIANYNVDAKAVHKACMKLEEYRDAIPGDHNA